MHPVLSGSVLYIAFYTAPFSSNHFFLGLFVRSVYPAVLFSGFAPLCMTAFSYVGLLSLFWVRLFHAVFPDPSSAQLLS